MYKRGQLLKESLLATSLMILVTFLVSFIPFKFEFLKIIQQEFLDIDIYDLYYSERSLGGKRDSNIVLVEIAADRASIANQIIVINDQQPAIIGVDAVFEDSISAGNDKLLINAIEKSKKIVLASRFTETENHTFHFKGNFFDSKHPSGFSNFMGGRYSVIRNYPPFIRLNDSAHYSFTAELAREFSNSSFEKLQRRNNNIEIINYTGNLENYTSLSSDELRYYQSTNQLSPLLKDKIVLLGFFKKQPPLVIEDLYFSPLNEIFAGKSYPDIYGVVVHANILSMILAGNYATLASGFVSYVCAFVITFLFLLYILHQYRKKSHPSHVKFLIVQFFAIILVLYFFLQIYNWFLIKIPLLPILISLVISVEFLGLYKIVATWFNKKTGYRTIFVAEKLKIPEE